MEEEGAVKVTATKVAVGGGAKNGELTLAERDDGDLVGRVANVAEDDVARVVGLGEVGLGDAVTESGGGSVVEEAERVEAGNLGGVEVGASLGVGEPERGGEDDVADTGTTELLGGGVTQLAEVHGEELGSGEDVLLTCEADLDTDLTLCVDELGIDKVVFDVLHLGVLESATYETLERADGVLKVGRLSGGSSLTEGSRLLTKRDERRSSTVGDLVGNDIDTTGTGNTDLGRSVTHVDTDDGRHFGERCEWDGSEE